MALVWRNVWGLMPLRRRAGMLTEARYRCLSTTNRMPERLILSPR